MAEQGYLVFTVDNRGSDNRVLLSKMSFTEDWVLMKWKTK